MALDKLQLQRFELKYIITPEVAVDVRDFIRSYLEIDEYGATQPNLSYTVHSLYLDSDDLRIYWGTINGDKNRYKLRIRFYENRPAAPVYFEIKRRMNDAILKQRGAVKRESAALLLSGQLPAPEDMVAPDEPRQVKALHDFRYLMLKDHAVPKAHVCYYREAWMSPFDNSCRVTLDREVKVDPEPTASFRAEMTDPVVVFGKNVVLELKFTGRFPDWFKELVRIFNLAQCSAAKYADGIALMGEAKVTAGYVLPEVWQNQTLEARKENLLRLRSRPGAAGGDAVQFA